jgi:hypothetical protein
MLSNGDLHVANCRVLPLRSEKHAGGPFIYGQEKPYPATLTVMTPLRSKAGQLT